MNVYVYVYTYTYIYIYWNNYFIKREPFTTDTGYIGTWIYPHTVYSRAMKHPDKIGKSVNFLLAFLLMCWYKTQGLVFFLD